MSNRCHGSGAVWPVDRVTGERNTNGCINYRHDQAKRVVHATINRRFIHTENAHELLS
jgi:hypothetical protein